MLGFSYLAAEIDWTKLKWEMGRESEGILKRNSINNTVFQIYIVLVSFFFKFFFKSIHIFLQSNGIKQPKRPNRINERVGYSDQFWLEYEFGAILYEIRYFMP